MRWTPATARVPPRSSAANAPRDQLADGGEQDGGVQRLGRRVGDALRADGTEPQRQLPGGRSAGEDVDAGARWRATCRVRWADAPRPHSPRRPPAGTRARPSAR